MTWGDFSAKNVEVYAPSFNDKQERTTSREKLLNTEKLPRIDTVDFTLEEFFSHLEKVAEKNISEAQNMAQAFILKTEYFAKIAGINPSMLNFVVQEAQILFKNYFASLEAANKKLMELERQQSNLKKELLATETEAEFYQLQNYSKNVLLQIKESYQRMSELYHLAEQKIENLFRKYLPRKNNLIT